MDFTDWIALYRFQRRRHNPARSFLRTLRKDLRRVHSRALLTRYIAPDDQGIEIGCGETTIAPIRRTLLSDGYDSHAGAKSLAKAVFPAESIPKPDSSFDFLLSEHVLEHLPDPIRALKEWLRVLRPGGVLFLFLPHSERTFDRARAVTPLQHLIHDHENHMGPEDETHWADWKEKVLDLGLAPHYQHYSKEESLKNNLIHRHVFTPASCGELLRHLNLEILEEIDRVPDREDSFVLVAKKGLIQSLS